MRRGRTLIFVLLIIIIAAVVAFVAYRQYASTQAVAVQPAFVEVYIAGEQAFELDPEGNVLKTVQFTDYVTENIRRLNLTAEHLREVWSKAEQRTEILATITFPVTLAPYLRAYSDWGAHRRPAGYS